MIERDSTETPLGWLGCPVPLLQRTWEMQQLLELFKAAQPARVLEIGTYHGGTLWHWLQNSQPGTRVVSVDNYRAGVDNRSQYASWCPDGVQVWPIAGDSRDPAVIAAVQALGPYDFIVIDADHYEAGVQADWDHYHTMARYGGIIALHDIQTAGVDWIQVDRVWARIKLAGWHTQEFIADPNLEWGGWGVVWYE